jgi:putative oxidoreductase
MRTSPALALLLVRVGFGVLLLVWGLSKIVNPGHTQMLFEMFYRIEGLGVAASMTLGALQSLLSLAIIAGFLKAFTYGLGLALHAVSTLATAPHLLLPLADGSNILFMAGLPVLLAAIGLFLAREHDTLLSLDARLRGGGTYAREAR